MLRRRPVCALFATALVALLAAACGGKTQTLRFGLAPNDAMLVSIEGGAPRVTVTNEGPDSVEIDWAPGKGDDVVTLGIGSSYRAVEVPAHIVVATSAGKGARVSVAAQDAQGLSIKMNPPDLGEILLKP